MKDADAIGGQRRAATKGQGAMTADRLILKSRGWCGVCSTYPRVTRDGNLFKHPIHHVGRNKNKSLPKCAGSGLTTNQSDDFAKNVKMWLTR